MFTFNGVKYARAVPYNEKALLQPGGSLHATQKQHECDSKTVKLLYKLLLCLSNHLFLRIKGQFI